MVPKKIFFTVRSVNVLTVHTSPAYWFQVTVALIKHLVHRRLGNFLLDKLGLHEVVHGGVPHTGGVGLLPADLGPLLLHMDQVAAVCEVGLPDLGAGQVLRALVIVFVDTDIEHLDEVPDQSPMNIPDTCCVVCTYKQLKINPYHVKIQQVSVT